MSERDPFIGSPTGEDSRWEDVQEGERESAPPEPRERYHGPACQCGCRRTGRIGETAYRLCYDCGRVSHMRELLKWGAP